MKSKQKHCLALVVVLLIEIHLLMIEPAIMTWAVEEGSLGAPVTALKQQYLPIALGGVIVFVLVSLLLSLFLYQRYYKRYWDKLTTREQRNKESKAGKGKQQIRPENG